MVAGVFPGHARLIEAMLAKHEPPKAVCDLVSALADMDA
jgi:hypothetical protein